MHTQSSLSTLTAADVRIRQLGNTMFEMLANGGECTRGLLRAEGFSNYELDTYGDAARGHANSRFVRKDSEGFTKSDDEIVKVAVGAGLGLIGDARIVSAMLTAGLTAPQISRNWTTITRKLGIRIGTLAMPQVA